jgi:hypothetical protein
VLGHCRFQEKKLEELGLIDAMLVVIREVLGVLSNPSANGMSDGQLSELYFKCTVITLFKICQFANMHYLLSKRSNSKSLEEQSEETIKFMERTKCSPIFDSIKK